METNDGYREKIEGATGVDEWERANRYAPPYDGLLPGSVVTTKPTNPKDNMGIKKYAMSCVSSTVLAELSLAMLEGALKYGRHNYRPMGVRASIYFDASMRHLQSYWEGQDLDPDSKVGIHHVTKAIASLTVLRDSMIQGNHVDDRPPKSPKGWEENINHMASMLVDQFPDPKKPFTEKEI